MAIDKGEKAAAIAPPLVILVCIAGAAAMVIAIAAISRLCHSGRTEAVGDIESASWNPNRRNQEQDKYMEEVRWRNNACAWERAKEEQRERIRFQRGWFKEEIARQRGGEQGGWTSMSVDGTDEDDAMYSYDASSLSRMY